jgi:simple sugar transport system permease protein
VIRFERRLNVRLWVRLCVPLGSLLAAFIIITLVLFVSGVGAWSTYSAMISASITSSSGLSETFVIATPIILTGLCATMAFRMGIYNIGGEGQLYMGAMAATAVALALRGEPGYVIIIAMTVAAALAGCVWSLIPGLLRAYFSTNEILVSLMLNYVAGYFISYLIFDSRSYWRDLTSAAGQVYPIGKTIPPASWWPAPKVGNVGVPLGLMVAVVLAVACAVCLRRSTLGLKIRMTAGSVAAARYSGLNVRRLIVVVMVLSGALAGIAGAAQIGSASRALDPTGLQQAQYGYAGIVAAALGAFDPIVVFAAGLLLGAITSAGSILVGPSFPVGLTGTIEWIILFSVISGAFLLNFRVRWRPRARGRKTDAVRGQQLAVASATQQAATLAGGLGMTNPAQVTEGGMS